MARLPVVLACWDYDRTRALLNGSVQPEGIDLTYLPIGMPEPAFRMLHHREFHAAEMSLSWYARTLFRVPRPFVAIPVFPSRMFRHSSIYINVGSGIREPRDLIGKRVGCPEYQMTAAVWIKGILADQYGVPVGGVHYFTGGLKEAGRRETPLELPPHLGINVQWIGNEKTLSDMLEGGEIDALYTAEAPPCFVHGSQRVVRLFADYAEAEKTYFRATGIFPIMHTIVLRQDVYQQHPWIAQSLTKAFQAAQRRTYADLAETVALKVMLPWLMAHLEETRATFGADDFWAYGLEPNRATLATFLRYSHEQGLSPRRLDAAELFAPETLEVSKI
jgi:4,5-dihydroxyphthalate decarboxylase